MSAALLPPHIPLQPLRPSFTFPLLPPLLPPMPHLPSSSPLLPPRTPSHLDGITGAPLGGTLQELAQNDHCDQDGARLKKVLRGEGQREGTKGNRQME
jgi:hypothetical protein